MYRSLWSDCYFKSNLLVFFVNISSFFYCPYSNEFSRNYIKLAMLALKAYVEEAKINSAKKLPPVGIEFGTSTIPV